MDSKIHGDRNESRIVWKVFGMQRKEYNKKVWIESGFVVLLYVYFELSVISFVNKLINVDFKIGVVIQDWFVRGANDSASHGDGEARGKVCVSHAASSRRESSA